MKIYILGGIKMNKYENAMKLMEKIYGNGDKDTLLVLGTIKQEHSDTGNPRPSVRMVNGIYYDGAFYVSTALSKTKTKEIEKNAEVSLVSLGDAFAAIIANGKASNLGWVSDEKNHSIREKMRKVFGWWYDENDENSQDSIVLRIDLTEATIGGTEEKYEVDFVKKEAK